MTMKPKKSAIAAVVGLLLAASSLHAQVCAPTPFNAGPADPVNGFAQFVVDSNGVGLGICTDPQCFFDPVVPGNAFSQTIGFGGEAFWYLAENTYATTGAAAVSWLLTMAVEAAFINGDPAPNEQFPFTRMRFRMGAAQPGIYTLTHPWGSKTFTVTQADPVKAVNDTVDIEFTPGGVSTGVVGPWLRWDTGAPAGYLGDGASEHAVTGSPCGNNFVRVSATTLNGVPLAIDPVNQDGDGSTFMATHRLFVVQGKTHTAATPISSSAAYYGRNPALSLTVFANSLPTASVSSSIGGALVGDGSGRFFLSTPVLGSVVPNSVELSTTSQTLGAATLTVPVTDLVTISKAEAVCTGAPKVCTLNVDAGSSDRDATSAPTLTLTYNNAVITGGTLSVPNLTAVPAAVTVSSTAGGSAIKSVTIVNQ